MFWFFHFFTRPAAVGAICSNFTQGFPRQRERESAVPRRRCSPRHSRNVATPEYSALLQFLHSRIFGTLAMSPLRNIWHSRNSCTLVTPALSQFLPSPNSGSSENLALSEFQNSTHWWSGILRMSLPSPSGYHTDVSFLQPKLRLARLLALILPTTCNKV